MGISNKHIVAGEIVRANGVLSFMLRLDNRQLFTSEIDAKDHDFARVFAEASKAILRSVDPYLLAAFHASNRATADSRAEAMRALAKFEGSPHYNKWLFNLIGSSFYHEGNRELALFYYQKAVEIDRNFSLAHTNIGNIYRDRAIENQRSGNKEKSHEEHMVSIHYYRNAIAIRPDSYVALGNIARAYRDIGDNKMAIRSYKALIKLKPDDVSYRLSYANLLAASGLESDAFDQFLRLSAAAPENAAVRNDYGAALGRSGRTSESVEQFKHAIQLRPGFVIALNNLGDAYLRLDRDEAALEMFGRALALNDRSLRAQRGLRAIYQRRGYDMDMLAELERELR